MNTEDRNEAIKYINAQLEDGYIDLGLHDQDELNIIEEAMYALTCIEQVRWERDIAIEQLREIGCELGQKMDDVKAKLDCVRDCRNFWKTKICNDKTGEN